jgi:UDP-glucuronate 4-epimerase
MKWILITGGAGFIGSHLTKYILDHHRDVSVVSVDNLNDYYDIRLKQARLDRLSPYKDRFVFQQADITDDNKMGRLFDDYVFEGVVNLAAQVGVTYSRENPKSYVHSNIYGFTTIIDLVARHGVKNFLYASSSSVYGSNTTIPWDESQLCASPMSLYAATKLSNELIAQAYSSTHNLSSIGMRFFNVYGPWGRPDMAYFKWASALLSGDLIEIRNNGDMYRDMTYIDDVVIAIDKLLFGTQKPKKTEIYNIGNREPVCIKTVLNILERELGIKSNNIKYVAKRSEEPDRTYADTSKLLKAIGFQPDTSVDVGLFHFTEWLIEYIGKQGH